MSRRFLCGQTSLRYDCSGLMLGSEPTTCARCATQCSVAVSWAFLLVAQQIAWHERNSYTRVVPFRSRTLLRKAQQPPRPYLVRFRLIISHSFSSMTTLPVNFSVRRNSNDPVTPTHVRGHATCCRYRLNQLCGIVHDVSLRSDGGRQLLSYLNLTF